MPSFHDIPAEISQHIFTLCMDPPEIYESVYSCLIDESFTTRDSILLVSKAWKAMAESTPGLWTLIQVSGDWANEKNLSLAQTWFLRSGTLPINLLIVHPTSFPEVFLQLLKSNVLRCRTLFMNLSHIDFNDINWFSFEHLLSSTAMELLNLRSLILFRPYNPPPMHYSVRAPNLKTLGLWNSAISTLGSLAAETLHALRTLDISIPDAPFDMRIFKKCPSLRHLLWRSKNPTRIPSEFIYGSGDFPIVLTHLTNLSFADLTPVPEFKPMWINDFFTTPGIKHLSYMYRGYFDSNYDSELPIININTFSSSSTSLITMRLARFTVTGISQGQQATIPFPKLDTLSIADSRIEDTFFDFLNVTTTDDEPGAPIMGGLSMFNIERCIFNVVALENWLHKRASSHLRLPRVEIICWDTQYLEVKELAKRCNNIHIFSRIAIWANREDPGDWTGLRPAYNDFNIQ
ncbi:hypothetical protein M422DRAFT_776721 [Sphaerobolus stellatus SS14]|nr:hypothetical protein M422DRAFT_776721 [Sphaerobolus stellatus SS14]